MDGSESGMNFLSKAKTLAKLEGKLASCTVLAQLCFSVDEFIASKHAVLKKISKKFNKVIIRSSAKVEDGCVNSFAGAFLSVLGVDAKNSAECEAAIISIIDSYLVKDVDDEFFVQPMLDAVECSGVLFTADPDTCAPYLIANMDFSGDTDSVTSGRKSMLKTFIYFNDGKYYAGDKYQKYLVAMAKELTDIFEGIPLDIEFAFANGALYLLQVRRLVVKREYNLSYLNMADALNKVSKKIEKLSEPHPELLGSRVIYGIMPDWNPAEIIGVRPKKLALSLYKELVTDSVWAYQRDNYGYRNLRSHPLLVDFLGVPFIDVRVSFNSFIPKALNDNIAVKLIDYYLNMLSETPHFHDKVEFEIIFSCYTLDLPKRLQKLKIYN